jgi:hypothetical protein
MARDILPTDTAVANIVPKVRVAVVVVAAAAGPAVARADPKAAAIAMMAAARVFPPPLKAT